jgi:hypothetical protein
MESLARARRRDRQHLAGTPGLDDHLPDRLRDRSVELAGDALSLAGHPHAAPRWVSAIGLAAAVLGGWLGLLAPVAEVADDVSTIGFLAFFVWMPAMGVTLLAARDGREDRGAATLRPAGA